MFTVNVTDVFGIRIFQIFLLFFGGLPICDIYREHTEARQLVETGQQHSGKKPTLKTSEGVVTMLEEPLLFLCDATCGARSFSLLFS